jgi:hypothetical protein
MLEGCTERNPVTAVPVPIDAEVDARYLLEKVIVGIPPHPAVLKYVGRNPAVACTKFEGSDP